MKLEAKAVCRPCRKAWRLKRFEDAVPRCGGCGKALAIVGGTAKKGVR